MAKDPAFLFYYQDFLVGTSFMNMTEVGIYIRILCHLADKGELSEIEIKNICGDAVFTDKLRQKFSKNKSGNFFNKRLKFEIDKRKNYSNSRRNNRLSKKHMSNICKSYDRHMENENENENIDLKNKETIYQNKIHIKKSNNIYDFNAVWKLYPKKIGRKEAERHFNASVKTKDDYSDLGVALCNFLNSRQGKGDPQYIPHGSTWFNNWKDWVNFTEPLSRDEEIRKKLYKE